MKLNYFDLHSHLNFSAYDDDRSDAIMRMNEAGVGTITVGTQYDTSELAVKLAEENENIYASVGLHPIHTSKSHHDSKELGEGGKEFTSRGEIPDIDAYMRLAAHPKVVAIGECGLDYYRCTEETIALQIKFFEQMIDVANQSGKPLMLHIRNGSGKSAYNDAFQILKGRSKVIGNLHFYAGSIEEAKPYLDMGYTFSFTGVITFTRDYDEIIKYLPADRIMSETDAPYVTPNPFRGQRNEPVYVREVVKAIAEIRREDEGQVAKSLLGNAQKFISIPPSPRG